MSQKKGSKGYNPISAALAKKKREHEQEEDRFSLFRSYTRLAARKLPWAAGPFLQDYIDLAERLEARQ